MAEKKSVKDLLKEEGVQDKPKKKRAKKKTASKKKALVETKAEKEAKVEKEIIQEAEEVAARREMEYPVIVLPARGYFTGGDRGSNVEALQTAMNHIVDANIPIDGILGPETLAAVEVFEKKYGGFPNGKFGTTELKAYNELRNE